MATLALNSGLWVRRLLIGGSPVQGRYPASEANDGTCPEKPVHLSWPGFAQAERPHWRIDAVFAASPLCREWDYVMPIQISYKRNQWLRRYLLIYNRLRKHAALGGRSPQQRLNELLD